MIKVVQIGPNLRFVVRDNQKVLQQVYKTEEDFDNGTRLVTTLRWVDVPIEVEQIPEEPKVIVDKSVASVNLPNDA